MTWTAITAGETDSDSPLDQALFDKIRTNDADHESRVLILEDQSNSRIFSHFVRRQGYGGSTTDDVILTSNVGASFETYFAEGFYVGLNRSGGTLNAVNGNMSSGNDDHYIRLEAESGGSGFAFLMAQLALNFTNRTKPLTFTVRLRQSNIGNAIIVGLIGWGTAPFTDLSAPPQGIWLNLNATNWRFSSKDGAGTTNGSDFTRVAADTWTEIQIIFESDPSNRARCFVDSVLKETLSANLPTARTLYGAVYTPLSSLDTLDIDRMEVSVGGAVSDL